MSTEKLLSNSIPVSKETNANELLLNNKTYKENNIPPKHIRLKHSDPKGLCNFRAFFFLVLWYIFSGCTLFLNKYILSYMHGDPTALGKILNVYVHARDKRSVNYMKHFYRYIPNAVDHDMWLHSAVHSLWYVQSDPTFFSSAWVLQAYDVCWVH